MSDYYVLLSSLINLVSVPVRDLDGRISIPVVSALLLGLIGSTSPCQLSTNVTALAFVSRDAARPHRALRAAALYLLGKVVVYSLLGLVAALVGLQLSRSAIPVVVLVRRALGPLLILGGLLMLGVWRPKFLIGGGLGAKFEDNAVSGERSGPFLLGMAFALAFCPTLFWLFFGLVVPMSLSSAGGLLFPGIFAVGTTLPLLALVGLLALGVQNAGKYLNYIKRFDRYARRVVGVVFILAGINEVILYWLV